MATQYFSLCSLASASGKCRMFRVSLHEERGCIFHVVLHDVEGVSKRVRHVGLLTLFCCGLIRVHRVVSSSGILQLATRMVLKA